MRDEVIEQLSQGHVFHCREDNSGLLTFKPYSLFRNLRWRRGEDRHKGKEAREIRPTGVHLIGMCLKFPA